MAIQRVRSKWAKTKVLLKSPQLKSAIPLTKRYSPAVLESMLDQFGMVYVKPVSGTYGNGVIRVEKISEPSAGYRYQIQRSSRHVDSIKALCNALADNIRGKSYIVQKGIHLLKHRKRRFDIRVMVQHNLAGQWESTGIIGRLSQAGNAVTNYHSGGEMMSFERLMSDHLSASDIASYKQKLKRLGTSVGRKLQTVYPGLKELGLDVAIDTSLKPWLLEVNTKPHPYVFRLLSDKSVFRKVKRYSLAYGGMKQRKQG